MREVVQLVSADVLARPWLVHARLAWLRAHHSDGYDFALQPGAQTPLSVAIIRAPDAICRARRDNP